MKVALLVILLLALAGFAFRDDIGALMDAGKSRQEHDGGKKKHKHKNEQPASGMVSIAKQWDLPAELKEISGLAWLDENRFACVQDEDGTVFIYNTASNAIERRIPFAGNGDYEGLTVKDKMVYVVRSDGHLYEVDLDAKAPAREYDTPLTSSQNIEGLCYDKQHDRLLLAAKEGEEGVHQKYIYAFDLKKKELLKQPAFTIDLDNELLNNSKEKKKSKTIRPSAIAINPRTNELFITDGPGSRLLVLTSTGEIRQLYKLGKDFAQPEGITFSPAGDMFISNEGTKHPGNILKVSIQ